MPYVNFISDEHFRETVLHVLNPYDNINQLRDSIIEAIRRDDIFRSDLFSNIVDPFKAVFEIKRYGAEEWGKKEILRQLDKSIEQEMGNFHQILLGGVDGWESLPVGNEFGVDLKNNDNTLFIELKNKYNTCNSGALKNVRRNLEAITARYNNATAYWAYIVPRHSNRSGEEVWVMANFNRIENVRKIWGGKVYELITEDQRALQAVYDSLPNVIKDLEQNQDLPEVTQIMGDILERLEPFLDEIQAGLFQRVFG